MSAPPVICSDPGHLDACAEPVEIHCYQPRAKPCTRRVHYRPGRGPGLREVYCEGHGRLAWPPQYRYACASPELDR